MAVLDEILERDPVRLTPEHRDSGCVRAFERLAKKYGIIGDIRGKGLLQGIEFVRDLKTKNGSRTRSVCEGGTAMR